MQITFNALFQLLDIDLIVALPKLLENIAWRDCRQDTHQSYSLAILAAVLMQPNTA